MNFVLATPATPRLSASNRCSHVCGPFSSRSRCRAPLDPLASMPMNNSIPCEGHVVHRCGITRDPLERLSRGPRRVPYCRRTDRSRLPWWGRWQALPMETTTERGSNTLRPPDRVASWSARDPLPFRIPWSCCGCHAIPSVVPFHARARIAAPAAQDPANAENRYRTTSGPAQRQGANTDHKRLFGPAGPSRSVRDIRISFQTALLWTFPIHQTTFGSLLSSKNSSDQSGPSFETWPRLFADWLLWRAGVPQNSLVAGRACSSVFDRRAPSARSLPSSSRREIRWSNNWAET